MRFSVICYIGVFTIFLALGKDKIQLVMCLVKKMENIASGL